MKSINIERGEELTVYLTTQLSKNSNKSTPLTIKHREDGTFTIYCDFPIDVELVLY